MGGRASLVMNGLLDAFITPYISSFKLVNTPAHVAKVQIASKVGRTYTLQHSPDLKAWQNVSTNRGNGGALTFDCPLDGRSKLYVRVQVK